MLEYVGSYIIIKAIWLSNSGDCKDGLLRIDMRPDAVQLAKR